MAAFLIVEVHIEDPDLYEEYKKAVSPTIAQYGGRYVVRGGPTEMLEGDREPGRIIVLEFESRERAKEWHTSEEYRGPKEIRRRAATARMIVVETFEG